MLAQRLAAQRLSGKPARSALEVVTHLLAVQGQDARGARLAIRARSTGLTAADVDRALTEERSLVITWLNRGTLHLVASEDLPWLHALTAPRHETAIRRRLEQEGVRDPDEAAAAVRRALRDGPLTRGELRERVPGLEGQAFIHAIALASLDGSVVRGPMRGRQHCFVLTADWLGPRPRVDREAALRALGTRYLRAHAPADEHDLARWAGITLGAARAALRDARPPRVPRDPPLPPPKLLGAFEESLLGWVDRAPILGSHTDRVTLEGIFRSFALVEGRAVATWRYDRGVAIEPLEPFDTSVLDAERDDVARFLG